MKKTVLVLSCEHAVNTVPSLYHSLFEPFQDLLKTHRGIDFGALALAKHMQQSTSCDLIQAHATRLLIDCNRSLTHSSCFSEVTRELSLTVKQEIIKVYYQPFRQQVMMIINDQIAQGNQVLHISVHSFTPVLHQQIRRADIGLLYNPQRLGEKNSAQKWKKNIKHIEPDYNVRMNYPYRGISDGFTSYLRKQFSEHDYMGIELETNQQLTQNEEKLNILKNILTNSLLALL